MDLETRCILQPRDPAFLHGRQQQPEPGDRDRIGVQIHAVNAVEGPLHEHRDLRARLLPPPSIDQPSKATEQKVPAAAGRVDHLETVVGMQPAIGQQPLLISHLGQPKLLDRRVERAVEDELLDEDGRLQQRVLLAGGLGEVLVEIAQEPRVPLRVGEIVDEHAGVGVDPLEERDQVPGGVAAQPVGQVADRVVVAEDLFCARRASSARRRPRAGSRGR